MQKTEPRAFVAKLKEYKPRTWQVVVTAGLFSIIIYHLTGSTSVGELLFLLLFLYLSIKAILLAFRIGSFLLKVLLVILVLLAWIGTFLAHSPAFR